ncbi:MAG: thioesterase family protein [Alphaproteobacteria bacterium]|nr:thioesterase family protein [Alphaproteobacteria bacterium]
MIYEKHIRVEFNHCDPAGIVFYPRYFEMFNSVIENFFADVTGVSFYDMHQTPGTGAPIVDAHARFSIPTRLNEVLQFTLEIEAVGRSSLKVLIKAFHGGTERLSANMVTVWMQNWKSHSWPKEMREKMLHFMEAKS